MVEVSDVCLVQEALSIAAEYIVELIGKREREIEIRKNNGFIREWTTAEKEESAFSTRSLLSSIYSSLKSNPDNFPPGK